MSMGIKELPEKGDYIIFKDNSLWFHSPTKEGLVVDFIGSCGKVKVKDRDYSPDWYDLSKMTICYKRKATTRDYLNQYDLLMVGVGIGLFILVVSIVGVVLLKAIL